MVAIDTLSKAADEGKIGGRRVWRVVVFRRHDFCGLSVGYLIIVGALRGLTLGLSTMSGGSWASIT